MNKVNRILKGSIIVNICLVIFKILVGIIGNSKAMIADGINTITDLTTDFIAIIGNKISDRPSNKKHPFGYGQIEYLTSIVVGIFIFIMGINLIIQAISKDYKVPSNVVLIVSVIVFIVKDLYSRYMLKMGYKYKNSILITSGMESKAGAITTLFVIISFIFSRLSIYNSIYLYSDNICTFIIGIYIIYVSYKILKDNVISIIGVNEEDNDYIEKIKNKVLSSDEIVGVNNVNLLKYGSYYSCDIEVVMKKNIKLKDISIITNKLKRKLCNKRTRIRYITISVVPEE